MSFDIKFDKNGLIPAIIQDSKTNEVLMMAYMNQESFDKTMETGKTHFWSRSRNKLWLKGETSGHFQIVEEIMIDCDNDTLLIKVKQIEGACHTGHKSCFHCNIDIKDGNTKETGNKVFDPKDVYENNSAVLQEVYNVIYDRKINPKEGSYTNYLFEKGIDKILKKVGEETAEVIIGSKNTDKGETVYEMSDLLYHLMVLMVEKEITLDDIYNELKSRR